MIEQATAARKKAERGVEAEEAERHSQQLEALHIAQQLLGYPGDYLVSRPTIDRVLETLERLEEDMVGLRPHPWRLEGDYRSRSSHPGAYGKRTRLQRGRRHDRP